MVTSSAEGIQFLILIYYGTIGIFICPIMLLLSLFLLSNDDKKGAWLGWCIITVFNLLPYIFGFLSLYQVIGYHNIFNSDIISNIVGLVIITAVIACWFFISFLIRNKFKSRHKAKHNK